MRIVAFAIILNMWGWLLGLIKTSCVVDRKLIESLSDKCPTNVRQMSDKCPTNVRQKWKIRWLTLRTTSSVLRCWNLSNCCWVIGGKMARWVRCCCPAWEGRFGCETRELVIEAIRWRGDRDPARSSLPICCRGGGGNSLEPGPLPDWKKNKLLTFTQFFFDIFVLIY